MEVTYIDRKTGEKCVEKIYGDKILKLLYGDGLFQRLFSLVLLPVLAHIPFFSQFYGFLQKRRASAKKIAPFIQAYGIDASEFVETEFATFNDFFIRKLKAEKRPIEKAAEIVVMPADGRYLVYPKFDQFSVKGRQFSINAFLQNISLANRFADGSMVIIRLCPVDYHRFHFPCDGTPSKASLINGPLYSVSPIALKKNVTILSENKRMITEIETEKFGSILYVEIGATSVGSIQQTYVPDFPMHKGDEKGYFEFGGSCIVLLFEKNRIVFDEDLVKNTENGFETLGRLGQSLGRSR